MKPQRFTLTILGTGIIDAPALWSVGTYVLVALTGTQATKRRWLRLTLAHLDAFAGTLAWTINGC